MNLQKRQRIVCGMSGGVDSSATAALLLEQGYEVIGITLKLWPQDCVNRAEDKCCGPQAVADARAVCNKLDIPYYLIDEAAEFQKHVIQYFADEYKAGRTPNPCVMCNQNLKFGRLIDRANQLGAQFVATGHFARVEYSPFNEGGNIHPDIGCRGSHSTAEPRPGINAQHLTDAKVINAPPHEPSPHPDPLPSHRMGAEREQQADTNCLIKARRPESGSGVQCAAFPGNSHPVPLPAGRGEGGDTPGKGRYLLKRGRDLKKDQSYFLFSLRQDQLARAVFPLGERTKSDARETARHCNLKTADKEESMEICFVPDNNYGGFLQAANLVQKHRGEITDLHGNVLGHHDGIEFYTIGQRKGLGITTPKPVYVIELDAETNRVVVGDESALERDEFTATNCNWIPFDKLTEPVEALTKIRYNHPGTPATLTPTGNGSVKVKLHSAQRAITPGQAAVFYQDDVVLGGGWIAR